jgi:hypothetical protein
MFATYLAAGLSVWMIAALFAIALCKGAKRGDEQF